jgi:hypothetical protein
MQRMARRHYRLVRIQLSRLGSPCAEQVPMEKPYPNRGWPQRAISLWDIKIKIKIKPLESSTKL